MEYQLSWLGKKYCEDDDITYADKEKAQKEFIEFLEPYAESGEQIVGKGKKIYSGKRLLDYMMQHLVEWSVTRRVYMV